MATILVVDDDAAQREFMQAVLRPAGHVVLLAADGEAGLELAVSSEPDLVCADVVMPRLNGFQLVAAMQSHPDLAGTPVLLVSSLAERMQIRTGMSAGADDYLIKPCRPDDLLQAVGTALRKTGVRERRARSLAEGQVQEALDAQRDKLANIYEARLHQELDSRWERSAAETDEAYPRCVLLLAQLYHRLPAMALPAERKALRSRCQRVRDAVLLFDAQRLLFQGEWVMAVFADAQDPGGRGDASRALRAAEALSSALPDVPLLLDAGEVHLLRLADSLQGEFRLEIAGGPAVAHAVEALAEALREGWPLSCTPAFARLEPALAAAIAGAGPIPLARGAADEVEQTLPVFDREDFERRYGSSRSMQGVVWRVFASHAPNLLEQLAQAVAAGATGEVARLAHSLKANAGMVSAARVRAHAQALEAAADGAQEADPAALQRLCGAIRRSFLEFSAVPAPDEGTA
ncbi:MULTISPECIES: response regulator [Ramlibacter]|uniref:Response regulator n=1 Tax=Ramlibacter aquaticus TaxID=2780094 RepID=A0ABR9SHG3_9BURK|nr:MULTISPECIES: response regulator [Ramlibacter]MBE7941802.1 response regulator [Ramlibacter aquaticus]